MNGYGIFYGKDGRIEKGNKLNDYKEGFYILKLPNDIIIKDYYINNLKEGFSYKYYPNGDIIIEEKKIIYQMVILLNIHLMEKNLKVI